jgi:large subunit ribosomal protein L21
MYAIVDILGQQFKVCENEKHYVPKLSADADSVITFDKVLLFSNGEEIKVGAPHIEGLKVEARVLGHLKDEKVIIFKKIRRKSYQKRNGHRQQLTRIEITKIG